MIQPILAWYNNTDSSKFQEILTVKALNIYSGVKDPRSPPDV